MKTVILYTTPFCGYCIAAKHMLAGKGVTFMEIDVAGDAELRREMVQKSMGGRTVPQIFIGDRHIGGFAEMSAHDRSGRLDAMIAL